METTEASSLGGHSAGVGLIIVKLVARLLCFIFTLTSLVTLATPNVIASNGFISSNGLLLYRYVLCSIMLGLVYSLLQISVSIYHLARGTDVSNNLLVPLDFYGDLVILYALATGVLAMADLKIISLMAQVEGNRLIIEMGSNNNSAATSLFLGSICSTVSLLVSTYDLYKSYFRRRYKLYGNNFC